jgi:hypothetical protein
MLIYKLPGQFVHMMLLRKCALWEEDEAHAAAMYWPAFYQITKPVVVQRAAGQQARQPRTC